MQQGLLRNLSITQKLMIVLMSAAAYFASFELNGILFSDLLFTHRVHWIYLPSGLRLLLVLVFFELGAIGIFLGSLAINYVYFFKGDYVFTVVTCLLSAGTPLLARYLAVEWFKLDINLAGLTPKIIFKMTILFSLLSSTLIQLWFFWNGRTENFLLAVAVMAVGKWFGTVLVLALTSFLLKFVLVRLHKD